MSDNEENLDREENNKDEDDEEEEEFVQKIKKLDDYQLPHKYLFRLCVLGDANVGKTSIITRFCDNSFKENYNNTIGVDFRLITLQCKDIISKIHIWDTAGQERFRSIATNYINSSHGFAFIYDVTDKSSFDNVTNWINLAFDKNKNSIFNFLIGNKCDLNNQRTVSQNEGEKLAKEKNLFFLETSAKNNENIQKIFFYFNYKLIQYYNKNKYVEQDRIQLSSTKAEELPTIRPNENKCKC